MVPWMAVITPMSDHQTGGQPRLGEQRLGAEQEIGAGVNRDRAVKDGARRRGALHGARQPSREWNLRGLSGGRQEEKQADDRRLRAGQPGKTAGKRGRSGPVMHGENADQQADVAGAINGEDAQTVFDRSCARWKNAISKTEVMPTSLPSAGQQIERTGGECEQRSEREEVQQQKEPEKATFAMQVRRRELSDQAGQHTVRPRNGTESRSAISTSGKW
jgi:hypothetical protein